MIHDLLGATLRLLSLGTLGVTVVAIGLGRASLNQPPQRDASQPPYQVLDHAIAAVHGGGAIRMYAETGELSAMPLPPDIGLDEASLAPWEQDGRRQLVGVGWSRSKASGLWRDDGLGLVRLSLPDAEILDWMPLSAESQPASPPCWVPNATASVVYVGGDGQLHLVDFDTSRSVGAPVPRLVSTSAATLRAVGVRFRDISWPNAPWFGGRALATVQFKDPESDRYGEWQIWWLRLDADGSAIMDAGRLLHPGDPEAEVSNVLPSVLSTEKGDPALAYLRQAHGETRHQARIVTIQFDPDDGAPRAEEAASTLLAEDCLPARPMATRNGRGVVLLRKVGENLRGQRVAIPAIGDGSEGGKTHSQTSIESVRS